jgi:hypothetical protein
LKKEIKIPVSVDNTKYRDLVIVNRSVKRIQLAVRMRRLRCRINALAAIARYAADIRIHTTLFMDEYTYNNIEDMVQRMNMQIVNEKFGFVERNCLVKVSAKTYEVGMNM